MRTILICDYRVCFCGLQVFLWSCDIFFYLWRYIALHNKNAPMAVCASGHVGHTGFLAVFLADDAATQTNVAIVQDGRLAWRDGPLRCFKGQGECCIAVTGECTSDI
jgi:hypothetical protein